MGIIDFFRKHKKKTIGLALIAAAIGIKSKLSDIEVKGKKEIARKEVLIQKQKKLGTSTVASRKKIKDWDAGIRDTFQRIESIHKIEKRFESQIALLEKEHYHQEGYIDNFESLQRFKLDHQKRKEILHVLSRFDEEEMRLWMENLGPNLWPYQRRVPRKLKRKFPHEIKKVDLQNFATIISEYKDEFNPKKQTFVAFAKDRFFEESAEELLARKKEKERLQRIYDSNEELFDEINENEELKAALSKKLDRLHELNDLLQQYILKLEDYIYAIEATIQGN